MSDDLRSIECIVFFWFGWAVAYTRGSMFDEIESEGVEEARDLAIFCAKQVSEIIFSIFCYNRALAGQKMIFDTQ